MYFTKPNFIIKMQKLTIDSMETVIAGGEACSRLLLAISAADESNNRDLQDALTRVWFDYCSPF